MSPLPAIGPVLAAQVRVNLASRRSMQLRPVDATGAAMPGWVRGGCATANENRSSVQAPGWESWEVKVLNGFETYHRMSGTVFASDFLPDYQPNRGT